LRNDGVFDALLPHTARLPFRTKLAVSVTAITATETAEADEKPVFDLAFTATELEPRKASATVVISKELARLGGDNANALILRELRNAVIAGTDSVATAALIAATSPIQSSGNVLTDLAALLAAVPSGASSRLFFVIEPSQAKILATLPGVNGAAFPQMNVNGGSIGGVTVLVSGQLAAGTAVLFDATAIAAASENVTLFASREAVVTMAEASSVSLWQQDLVALRAERWFGFSLLRAYGVASLSGVDYSGVSP
jgi:HK97 family phage major capsid protein